MTKEIEKQEWYRSLVDDCKVIITEAVFNSRWALVEGYWNLGKRIREDKILLRGEYGRADSILQGLAKSINVSTRTIHYALAAYDQYPDLQQIPEGKNITWNKLITKYLTAPPEKTAPLPAGKYGVIYADPPWPYPERLDPKNLYGAASYHYDRLSIDKLCELPVKEKAAENSVLFLWAATNFLEDSFKVVKAWGFDYKSNMVWVKEKRRAVFGYYVSGEHELLLIATRGSYLPKTKNLPSSVIKTPIQEHSRKPAIVYDIIEYLYPMDNYLELFARNTRVRWKSWGDETDKFGNV
ncbi:MAG: MT-A70 family methyltransferase [Candidatus Nitrosotenuis sp.]